MKTILPQLSKWKKSQTKKFNRRYIHDKFEEWNHTPDYKKWYHIDSNGYKSRVGGATELQMFLDLSADKQNISHPNAQLKLKAYTTCDGKTFTNLDEANYKYLIERDKMLKIKK